MKTISLNGPWRMRKAGAARFYDVTVPTTVCTDLLANGLLEDPYYLYAIHGTLAGACSAAGRYLLPLG